MKQKFWKVYREPGNGSDKGGGLPPSLKDLENPEDPLKVETPIEGGDGKDKLVDLPIKPKPGEEGYVEPKKGEPGYILKPEDEGYVAPKKGEVGYVLQPGDEGYVAPESEEEVNFFEEVEKHTGKKVEVTYPEGIDPVSPEGVAVREKVIRAQSVQEWEAYLQEKYPRAYAYMIHHSEGGADTDFFTNDARGLTLPTKEAFAESIDTQTMVYKYDLQARGLDADAVEVLVAKAIKDNKLKEKAELAYTNIETAQREQLEDLKNQQKSQQEDTDRQIANMGTGLDKLITNDISFTVPEASRPAFKKFMLDNMQYDPSTKKFYLVQPITNENIKSITEAMLFQHIGGDMKKVIDKKVTTKVAQGLRLKAEKSKQQQSGDSTSTKDKTEYVPLGDL